MYLIACSNATDMQQISYQYYYAFLNYYYANFRDYIYRLLSIQEHRTAAQVGHCEHPRGVLTYVTVIRYSRF